MIDPHVQQIMDWRESMTLFPEDSFFELVRTYLGAIQTPYNKQKIVEELGAFLKNAENREKMLLMLDDTDRTILCAINMIADCSSAKLTAFFSGVFTSMELFNHLVSLEERLFIYSFADSRSGKKIIRIVPYMKELVADFSNLDRLIPLKTVKTAAEKPAPMLSQSFIAVLLSYIAENGDVCKADFTLKKKAVQAFTEIFPSLSEDEINDFVCKTILSLFRSGVLKNKPSLRRLEGNFIVDFERAAEFAKLETLYQYAILGASGAGQMRSETQEYGELLISILLLLEGAKAKNAGLTKSSLLKACFLINEKNHEHSVFRRNFSTSRFSQLISRGKGEQSESEESAFMRRADELISNAISLGILKKIGADENGESLFGAAEIPETPANGDGKVLSADAEFSVTILPGLSLLQLLPLMRVLIIRRFDTACVFELTKESAMRGFSSGLLGEELIALLQKHSQYPLPQNVSSSIEDWFSSYNSATLFKGFVLQVVPEKELIIQKNPNLSRHIVKKIAPGVFFMDFEDDKAAEMVLSRSRLDYISKVEAVKQRDFGLSFPFLSKNPPAFHIEEAADNAESESHKSEREAYLKSLEESVQAKRMDSDKRAELISRIHRRLISNPSQLTADSVRIEKLEAGAMDYIGKVHVIDQTIASKSMLEIKCDGETVAGKPESIEKRGSDSVLTLITEPDEISRTFSVSSLLHVKRIHSALFSSFFSDEDKK